VDAFEPLSAVDSVAAGPRRRQFLLQRLAVSQRRGRERFQRAAAKPFATAFVAKDSPVNGTSAPVSRLTSDS
jgi:hypothetical protein